MGRAERKAARIAKAAAAATKGAPTNDDLSTNEAGEPVAPLDGRYSRQWAKTPVTPNDKDMSTITAAHQGSLQK